MADPMQVVLHHLLSTGSEQYASNDIARCAETYRRAREMAAALGDRPTELFARFWEGCAHHGGGHLRRALAVMAPAVGRTNVSLSDGDVYRVVTRYLRVLADVPAESTVIERALDAVDQAVVQGGHPNWRSRSTLVRARIALSSGEWDRCWRLARKGLEQRREDPLGCTRSSYYWESVLASIYTGRLEQADRWLEEWRENERELPSQEIYRAWLRSCWLRRSGRPLEALDYARTAYEDALRDGDYPCRFSAAAEYARLLLSLGDLKTVLEPLAYLVALRHTEVGEHAFAVRVLLADHHHARARQLAHLPSIDLEFHHTHAPHGPGARTNPQGALTALLRSKRGYEQLAGRGHALDEAFDSRLREWQISDRLTALVRTREEIG